MLGLQVPVGQLTGVPGTHAPAWHVELAPVFAVQSAATQHSTATHASPLAVLQHRSPVPHAELIGLPEHAFAAETHEPLLQLWPGSQSASERQPTHWLSMHCWPPQSALVWQVAAMHAPWTHRLPAP